MEITMTAEDMAMASLRMKVAKKYKQVRRGFFEIEEFYLYSRGLVEGVRSAFLYSDKDLTGSNYFSDLKEIEKVVSDIYGGTPEQAEEAKEKILSF